MTQTYQISEFHMEWFKDYIEKINKRAVKLGQKEITYKIISESIESVEVKTEVEEGRCKSKIVMTKVFEVEVEMEVIKVDGYRFIASLEHTYENGNIVHNMSDAELPIHYHTVDGKCEHCNTNRRRKITVILQNEEGKFLQIGRSCLKDFIGYDVESKLKYADLMTEIEAEISRGCGGGAGYVPYVNLAKYLTFVEQEINENGWVSRSNVDDVKNSTSYKADIRMTAWDMKNDYEDIQPSGYVENAIEWIRTTGDTSKEYMMNLQIMCKNDYVRTKDMGYVASLLNTYKNHLDYIRRQELKARAKDGSKHVGVVGKREVFELTMEKYTWYDTMYGTTWIYIFRDKDGNCIVWKSSKCIECNEGQSYKIKGTVKEYSEFNGEKQTILTRCAVLSGSN